MSGLNAAQILSSRGLGATRLPVSGVEVSFHIPHTRAMVAAGLFPLHLSSVDLADVDPDEREHLLAEADRNMVKLICACCSAPVFTQRENPREHLNEVSVDSLCPEDFAHLGNALMELIAKSYAPPAEETKRERDGKQAIALACRIFALDPTTVEEWEPARTQSLIDYATLAAEAMKNGR